MLAGAVPVLPGVPGDEACVACSFAVFVFCVSAIPLKFSARFF